MPPPDASRPPSSFGTHLPMEVLAEAVEALRRSGYVTLRTLSAALGEAVAQRTLEAEGFAERVFNALDPSTRREILEQAVKKAAERARARRGQA